MTVLDARARYMLDVRNFTCRMMEEACAFRAQVSADRRRAARLVEELRRAVAAIRLQASSRRLLAVRTFGRTRIAKQVAIDSSGSSDAAGRATRRAARRWLGCTLRIIRCAGDRAREAEGQRWQAEQRASCEQTAGVGEGADAAVGAARSGGGEAAGGRANGAGVEEAAGASGGARLGGAFR